LSKQSVKEKNRTTKRKFEELMKNTKYILAVMAAGAAVAISMQKANAQDTVLTGNTLLVGINNGGSVVEDTVGGPTPTSPFIGIQYDATGTGNYSLGYDFITPGDPYQYFAVGVNGSYAANSYDHGNPLGLSTANTSSGTTLQTTSTGGSFGGLGISQTMSFQKSGAGSGIMAYSVTLQNTTGATLNNVAYSTGLDPDQDVYFDGNYATANTITGKNYIYATGLATAWTIAIANTSAYTPTGTWIADQGWDYGGDTDPYTTTYGTASGSLVGPGSNYADDTINMDWNLGSLLPGQSIVLNYDYVIAGTPAEAEGAVPDSASTLGLLGLALVGVGAVRRKLMA
jgi:hypothetical protein